MVKEKKRIFFFGVYLLLLLKGFSHEYLKKYSFPTINRIQNQGIKTKYGMQPTFVTMTYPNHISIATGGMKIFFLIIYLYVRNI
jgi:predicted AlkP superfamily pyrophosphatase or phosphodiesterase